MVRSIPLKTFVMCLSKVAHAIEKGILNENIKYLEIQKDCAIAARLCSDDGTAKVNTFDMAVYSAVISLYAAGMDTFSISEICRALCLDPKMVKVGGKMRSHVLDSVEKLQQTYLWLETSRQAKSRATVDVKYDGKMLELEALTARTDNGKECLHFRLRSEPLLYRYSKDCKQVYLIPMKKVSMLDKFSNTILSVVVRHALLRRIVIILRNPKNPNIKYSELTKECGFAWDTKDEKMILRSCVRKVLLGWVKTGLIGGFHEYRDQRTIIGVTIERFSE